MFVYNPEPFDLCESNVNRLRYINRILRSGHIYSRSIFNFSILFDVSIRVNVISHHTFVRSQS